MDNLRQIVKKQHWVPRFYLKQFASEDFLQVFDRKNWKLSKATPYSGVCYGEFFYSQETGTYDEISQEIEDYFKAIESNFSAKLDKILKNIFSTEGIKEEYLDSIAYFMATLWFRSKHQRKRTNRMVESISKEMASRVVANEKYIKKIFDEIEKNKNEKISDDSRKRITKMIKEKDYDLKIDNYFHLYSLVHIEQIRNWFMSKKWRFYLVGKEFNFFTSDTPVIDIPVGRGCHIAQINHYFPLTSKVLIELSDPCLPGKRVKRKTFKNFNSVLRCNLLRINHSDEFIYSPDSHDFQHILRNYVSKNQKTK
jgi:hypothetical protein